MSHLSCLWGGGGTKFKKKIFTDTKTKSENNHSFQNQQKNPPNPFWVLGSIIGLPICQNKTPKYQCCAKQTHTNQECHSTSAHSIWVAPWQKKDNTKTTSHRYKYLKIFYTLHTQFTWAFLLTFLFFLPISIALCSCLHQYCIHWWPAAAAASRDAANCTTKPETLTLSYTGYAVCNVWRRFEAKPTLDYGSTM